MICPHCKLQVLGGNAGLRSQAGGLAPALVKTVNEGVAKATMRADGICALLAAAHLASADATADALFTKEKVSARVKLKQNLAISLV